MDRGPLLDIESGLYYEEKVIAIIYFGRNTGVSDPAGLEPNEKAD